MIGVRLKVQFSVLGFNCSFPVSMFYNPQTQLHLKMLT